MAIDLQKLEQKFNALLDDPNFVTDFEQLLEARNVSPNSSKPLVIRRSEKFRVRCSCCGKVTAARLPRSGKYKGDGTFWFPRRHKVNGVDCRGNIEEAEVIECYGV